VPAFDRVKQTGRGQSSDDNKAAAAPCIQNPGYVHLNRNVAPQRDIGNDLDSNAAAPMFFGYSR